MEKQSKRQENIMSELINMGTLLKRVDELERKQFFLEGQQEIFARLELQIKSLAEQVKHLEEHYNFELRKDIEEEDNNQMPLPLEETKVLSPLQDWETQ